MAARENVEAQLRRWEELGLLQRNYEEFEDFLDDVMTHLGFDLTWVQEDIGKFLAYGPKNLMVQAQRGQAKTTITAAFAVWTLIHNPKARILILSAGGKQANEISTLVVKLIMTMDELGCLRPDTSNGDRSSVEAFDVHYSLKGVDKSPSVACTGIGGNLQGKRADLLIADDIESTKNALTALMREQLLHLTRDFTSICTDGRIIYLGTPQTQDSIYNSLPGRGFVIRIWPGRYPTPEQITNYGDMLAPALLERLRKDPALCFSGGILGDQGQPVEVGEYLGEFKLQEKELDQGPTYFQLQHMLNTRLADAARYPLKPENLIVMRSGNQELYPMEVTRGYGGDATKDYSVGTLRFKMTRPHAVSPEVGPLTGKVMYVDPAGGGKISRDETAYAIVGLLNSKIYVFEVGGVAGGYGQDDLDHLARRAHYWGVNTIKIEKNMGHGAFCVAWTPSLRRGHTYEDVEYPGFEGGIMEDYVTGQKELRIIETLEPVMARGAIIFNEEIVTHDGDSILRYSADQRQSYSLFQQMSRITRERNSLVHDDRLDALEGAVRHFQSALAMDEQAAAKAAQEAQIVAWSKDPMGRANSGYARFQPRPSTTLDRFRRR